MKPKQPAIFLTWDAPTHPKIASLSAEAYRFWTACLCYSARHHTDGSIPTKAIHTVPFWNEDLVVELLGAGLLEDSLVESRGTYVLHDYLDYQQSRADYEKNRKDQAARQAAWRARQQGQQSSQRNVETPVESNEIIMSGITRDVTHNSPVSHGVSHTTRLRLGLQLQQPPTPNPTQSFIPEVASQPQRASTAGTFGEMWRVCSECFGAPVTQQERSRFGGLVRKLVEAHVTPEQVAGAAEAWPNVRGAEPITLAKLVTNLGQIINSPNRNGRSGGVTRYVNQSLTQRASMRAGESPDDTAKIMAEIRRNAEQIERSG